MKCIKGQMAFIFGATKTSQSYKSRISYLINSVFFRKPVHKSVCHQMATSTTLRCSRPLF